MSRHSSTIYLAQVRTYRSTNKFVLDQDQPIEISGG
jgi:hypothetical protein